MQISRIRLSDKTSRLHPRPGVPKRSQADEAEVPVQVREWIGPALASPDLVLDAQPPAHPHSGVVVDRPIRACRLPAPRAIDTQAHTVPPAEDRRHERGL